jgi:hypothetical protein
MDHLLRAGIYSKAKVALPLARLIITHGSDSVKIEMRICPYPFSRMEASMIPFVPCCQTWLKDEYHQLELGEDPWNGPAAQELRRSIIEGNYKYCHLDRCSVTLLDKGGLDYHSQYPGELPISEKNMTAIFEGSAELPDGPTTITIRSDPRCNLACPSCRPEKIVNLTPAAEASVKEMEKTLARHAAGIKILKFAGDGEVFFSPGLRRLLRDLNPATFPKLQKVDILTNGTLFDAEALAELRPGSDYIRTVNVSIDAGDEITYAKVRGGDWNRLRKNLNWMAAERKKGRFDFLALTFVLRAANLNSVVPFLELAEELQVDEAYIGQLLPWERMGLDFNAEAIHNPDHPRHADFAALWPSARGRNWSFKLRSNLPIA